MYRKDLPNLTVTDLLERVSPESETRTVASSQIQVAVNNQPDDFIRIGTDEIPATGAGLVAIGEWLDLPSKVVEKFDADVLTFVLNTMLTRNHEDVSVTTSDRGVLDAFSPSEKRIDPARVIEIAARVVSPDAQVVDFRRDNKSYGFEVIGHQSVVEEAELIVNDISSGGLRFGHDWKQGYLPWVQPYVYRLVCTNGMEIPDATLAITSQGNTLEEVIASLEEKAEIAFGRVESDIAAFYDLKNHPVVNPERTLTRMGREQGLSDARLRHILEGFPEYLDEAGGASQFDLVNAITNEANLATMDNRFNAQRSLQRAGGAIAFEHKTRCPACSSQIDA